MSEKMLNTRIQQKHDIEVNWSKAVNFIPKIGEVIVYDPDENHAAARVKIGDGVKTVVELAFIDDAAKAALFKEIDMVDEKVEALGQLVGDASIPEQIEEALLKTQADWEVNDETSAAYVKNRTHWDNSYDFTYNGTDIEPGEDYEYVTAIETWSGREVYFVKLSDTPLSVEELADGKMTYYDSYVDMNWEVRIDHSWIISDNDYAMIKNIPIGMILSIFAEEYSVDNFFGVEGANLSRGLYTVNNTGFDYKLRRFRKADLHKIDDKYLADNIARIDNINWEDIKNRPFHEVYAAEDTPIGEYTLMEDNGHTESGITFYEQEVAVNLELEIGKEYEVKYGDQVFITTAVEAELWGDPVIVLGDPNVMLAFTESNGETKFDYPFCLVDNTGILFMQEGYEASTISVHRIIEVEPKQLDPKFIPTASEEQLIQLLIDIDALPAMTDSNGAIFTHKDSILLI